MRKLTALSIVLALLFLVLVSAKKGDKIDFFKDPKGFVFIPMGNIEIDGKSMSVQSFYMSQAEITNGQYQLFLDDLLKQGKTKEYEIAKMDTTLWNKIDFGGNTIYASTYHKEKDFPVVNISKAGAMLYCVWLTEKYNKESSMKTFFRLPLESEWEYAAIAGKSTKDRIYPWDGKLCHNAKGAYLAQFKALGIKPGPAKVKSYFENDFGLYDLSGNVAEILNDSNMVKGGHWNSNEEEIKITSNGKYEISPMVGFRPVITFLGKKN